MCIAEYSCGDELRDGFGASVYLHVVETGGVGQAMHDDAGARYVHNPVFLNSGAAIEAGF